MIRYIKGKKIVLYNRGYDEMNEIFFFEISDLSLGETADREHFLIE